MASFDESVHGNLITSWRTFRARRTLLIFTCALLSACGGGGNDGTTPPGNPPPVVNLPPVANAGPDQVVATATNVVLNGAGSSDPDGTIGSYAWTQQSGTAVALVGASSATPSFAGPATSTTLTFQLSVTDSSSAVRTDSVTIVVNAPPSANAGADQTVAAGSAVTLSGSATDANGTVASYAWTQLSGTAVTLIGANTASPTFSAPTAVANLNFQLTATDNHGATHSDTVAVSVNALLAPAIVRFPTTVTSSDHGTALFFVVASGEGLNYEWRSNEFGTLVKTGPEPFYMRADLSSVSHDGDCFWVVVSNSAGSVTSGMSCLDVIAVTQDITPTSHPNPVSEGELALAEAYGNSLLGIASDSAGLLTGSTLFGQGPFAAALMQPHACGHSGSYTGSTLDGVAITAGTLLPLGSHAISMVWNNCRESADEVIPLVGAVLIHYNFPTQFGVGTYTKHFSGYGNGGSVINGTLNVSRARTFNGLGNAVDTIDLAIEENFSISLGSFATLRQSLSLPDRLGVTRTMNSDETFAERADLDLTPMSGLSAFDSDGYLGAVFDEGGGIIRLNRDGTHGGDMDVRLTTPSDSYFLSLLLPGGGPHNWHFSRPPLGDDD